MNNVNLIYDINLIAKIVDFDLTILYNMLCVSKYIKNELLKNITVLSLPNNTKIEDCHLKYIPNIHTLDLSKNQNITDEGLQYILNIYTLNLSWNKRITDEGLK